MKTSKKLFPAPMTTVPTTGSAQPPVSRKTVNLDRQAPSDDAIQWLHEQVEDRVQTQRHRLDPGFGDIVTAAHHGIRGSGGPLPHLDRIQSSFGRHDVSSIVAHNDEAAITAARAMGATAFTTRGHVAFAGNASLQTAAHEAAHVVQQRSGLQLDGGIGQVGDRHEQHADEVAARVEMGASSESLLDRYAHPTESATQAAPGPAHDTMQLVCIAPPRSSTASSDVVQAAAAVPANAPPLSAALDAEDAAIVVFNREVSVDEAGSFLWGASQQRPGAIAPAPGEASKAAKYRRFVIDIRNDLAIGFTLRHGLAAQFLQRIQNSVLRSRRPPVPPLEDQPTPSWLPSAVKHEIFSKVKQGEFSQGLPKVFRYAGEPPGGAIVVWVGPSEFDAEQTVIELAQYFSEDAAFYKSKYPEPMARRSHEASIEWNRDFAVLVEQRQMRPSEARLRLREENASVAVLVAGGFALSLAGASGPSRPRPASRTSALPLRERVPEPAVPLKPAAPEVPIKAPAKTPGPLPEALEKGMVSKAPPVKIKGEMTAAGPVVRKAVTEGTLLGRTRLGKAWGQASLKAQEKALQELEAAGLDAAAIRQRFQDTGELVIDYVGASVQSQWSSMSSEAKAAYRSYVSMAKKVLGRGPLHDLKPRNIAYERIEAEGVVVHRFIAFDPALDNATLLVGICAGTAIDIGLAVGLDKIIGIFSQRKVASPDPATKP